VLAGVRSKDSAEIGGKWVKKDKIDEKGELQAAIRDCLRHREVPVEEATELAGGEVDLLVRTRLVLENKKTGATSDPFAKGPHYVWQARRYALSVCQNVLFVVVAYKPSNEAALLPLTQRIRVVRFEAGPEGYAQVRIVIPYGQGLPHDAKAPPKDPTAAGEHPCS
jgi:hypothetical protein